MKKEKEHNKSEKLGSFLGSLLLIAFLVFLIQTFWYPANEYTIIKKVLLDDIGGIYGFSFLCLILLGALHLSNIFYNIIEKIFYPDNDLDIEIKELKKSNRKNRMKNRKNLRREIRKKRLEYKLQHLDDQQ